MVDYDIAIIGGGASGLMAAVSAAGEYAFQKRVGTIVILEGNSKLGKKLLATGNGRCNLSNSDLDIKHYHGDAPLAAGLFQTFGTDAVKKEFASMGLMTWEDAEGRVYPYNRQAAAVVKILENRAEELGVSLELGFNAFSVIKSGSIFVIKSADGREIKAKKCIIATGGLASPKHSCGSDGYKVAKSLGHAVVPTHPCLVQLTSRDKFIKNLAGVRARSKVKLLGGSEIIAEEEGELLFADKAISGICVFQLSVYASEYFFTGGIYGKNYAGLSIEVDFAPEYTEEALFEFLKKHRNNKGNAGDFLCGVLNMKIGREIMRACKVDFLSSALSDGDLESIVKKIKSTCISVDGIKGYEDAQITAGGIPLSEIDSRTFESRKVKGLYMCGEILNLHGDCGGYNLHFAWASGISAGRAAAQ